MRVMAPDTALAGGSSAIIAFRSRKVGHRSEPTRGECSGCAHIFSKKGSTRRAKTPPKVRLPTQDPLEGRRHDAGRYRLSNRRRTDASRGPSQRAFPPEARSQLFSRASTRRS